MGSRSSDQTALRRVRVVAIVALVLLIAAVTLVEVDQAVARDGNELPQEALTVTKWFAIAFGFAALLLWVLERFRSRVKITVGVVIALVVVIATPIAIAIATPDDTPMTVAAFDARTGEQRWEHDVDLLFESTPVTLDGNGRVVLFGPEGAGRCHTRDARFTIDPTNGRTVSHTSDAELPSPEGLVPTAPARAGDIRLEVEGPRLPPTDSAIPRSTLHAVDPSGKVLWSTLLDGDRAPAAVYADDTVVAAYVPDSFYQPGEVLADDPSAGPEAPLAVLDARSGRRLWTMHSRAYQPPVFGPKLAFSIEGEQVLVRATATGSVVARYPFKALGERSIDAQLQVMKNLNAVALVEGGARRVTLFARNGTVRWKATLPRVMPFPVLTALGDTVYIAGGGRLGYSCGGD